MKGTAENIILIGGSAGSYMLINEILEQLPSKLDYALCIVIHRNPKFNTKIESSLSKKLDRTILSIHDKTSIHSNSIYFAPPGYHTLIEPNKTFSLDCSEHINYSRPSIDVLFETAAQVYGKNCKAFLLSGANNDGANGIKTIEEFGGKAFIQHPEDALIDTMPASGLQESKNATVFKNQEIISYFSNTIY